MLTTLPQKAEPAHTALILVDVLNAFCAEGGAMHREGRDLSLVKPMMPRLHKLIHAARAAKIKLVWIQCAYNTGPNHYLSEVWLEQAKRRRNGAYTDFPVCEPGKWDQDFYEVRPLPTR
jgi:ureidoacrylate peracid hydrolase